MKSLKLSAGVGALAAAVAFASSAFAQSPAAKVDALFARWDTTVTPGCTLAVSQNGEIVHSRGYGMANLEHGVPNRPDTVVHIASVSKQFTAAAIAMLILENKLSANDPIRKYLPEMPEFDHVVTVGQLVHHTSGLRDHSDVMELSGWRYYQDLVTTEDAMSVLAKQKTLLFVPGSRYHYSNTNYLLMSEIVERVSGQSFREFTNERIFKPLGMTRSHFRDTFAEIVPNFANGYDRDGDRYVTSLTQFSIVGYSTLLTTVEDLMKWEENFYTGKVGGKPLFDLMHSTSKLNDGSPNKYAFGIVVEDYRGLPRVDHSGGDAGYSTYLVRFPSKHLSVAVLCNSNTIDAEGLAMKSAEIYLGLEPEARKAPVAVKVPTRELAAKAGRYLGRESEEFVVVELRDGQLFVDDTALTPIAGGRFVVNDWTTLSFPSSASITVHEGSNKPHTLDRIADYNPDANALANYVGTYTSDEIDAPFRILIVDGALVLRSIKFKKSLSTIAPDLFSAGWANVAFKRDTQGQITGFRYGREHDQLANFVRR